VRLQRRRRCVGKKVVFGDGGGGDGGRMSGEGGREGGRERTHSQNSNGRARGRFISEGLDLRGKTVGVHCSRMDMTGHDGTACTRRVPSETAKVLIN
jgi:hypothetical protein